MIIINNMRMVDVATKKIAEAYRVLYKDLVAFLRGKLHGESPEVAQDIAHDTFAYWLQHEGRVDVVHPRAYLTQVAGNMLRDYWRYKKVRQHEYPLDVVWPADCSHLPMSSAEPCAPVAMQPDRQLEARQQLSRLQKTIEDLPPRQREAFLLRKVHHLANADIATRMGISVRMVEQHLHSAMLQCRKGVYQDEDHVEGRHG